MNTLVKLALAGGIVGALAAKIARQERQSGAAPVADTNLVHGGDPESERDRPQPQDWQSAQNYTE